MIVAASQSPALHEDFRSTLTTAYPSGARPPLAVGVEPPMMQPLFHHSEPTVNLTDFVNDFACKLFFHVDPY
jgi:hypothetical protein